MNAGDASTLRQVSLAALLGLDARVLLRTDDTATHVVYDKVIEQTRDWYVKRTTIQQQNQAYYIVDQMAVLFGRKRR